MSIGNCVPDATVLAYLEAGLSMINLEGALQVLTAATAAAPHQGNDEEQQPAVAPEAGAAGDVEHEEEEDEQGPDAASFSAPSRWGAGGGFFEGGRVGVVVSAQLFLLGFF